MAEGKSRESNSSNKRFMPKFKRKSCRFCAEKTKDIDYKNVVLLRGFITERGKMISARTTGNCAYHQRQLTVALKRARNIGLLPFFVA